MMEEGKELPVMGVWLSLYSCASSQVASKASSQMDYTLCW
jgi:hypothetical protein